MNQRECYVRSRLYLRDTERIQGCRQRLFIHWNRAIKDIMRSRVSKWIIKTVKVYTWADRGLEDRVTAHEVRAVSASWAYNSSGGATWHSVSGVLEVVRGLSEFVSAQYGQRCWWDVNIGSCRGRSTSSGSRTSSLTSIAYTICM